MEKITTKELKSWVSALGSGEYKQCSGSLEHIDQDEEVSYCCIGALNRTLNVGKAVSSDELNLNESAKNSEIYNVIRLKLGRDNMSNLIVMNDRGKSFERIADEIEMIPQECEEK